MGALPPGPPSQAIEAWRQNGGTVEIPWLNLVWGPLDLRAKGTATLDGRMRPLGALTADIRGYRETLTAFASAGLVPPDTALAVAAPPPHHATAAPLPCPPAAPRRAQRWRNRVAVALQ